MVVPSADECVLIVLIDYQAWDLLAEPMVVDQVTHLVCCWLHPTDFVDHELLELFVTIGHFVKIITHHHPIFLDRCIMVLW